MFPCRECDGRPYLKPGKGDAPPETVTPRAKAPYVTIGLKAATTDEEQIKTWWRQYPNALIGLPLGRPSTSLGMSGDEDGGIFALDFDPRHDAETGEDFTLERLKADMERLMGCVLPESLAVRTPSGGVHLYLVQPPGEAVRNRGNLPSHVDVRGQGGYVIAPPSRIVAPCGNATAGVYRWLRGRVDAPVATAPPVLIDILRDRRSRKDQEAARDAEGRWTPAAAEPLSERPRPSTSLGTSGDDLAGAANKVDAALRRYALGALDGELREVRAAGTGKRNAQLNTSALKIASLVAAGVLDAGIARASLEAAARDNPGRDDSGQLEATINSGWTAGMNSPRDLEEIAAAARDRASRSPRSPRSSRSPPTPGPPSNGKPSSQAGGSDENVAAEGAPGKVGSLLTADNVRECAFLPLTDLGNLERFLVRYGGDFLFVEAWGWLAWDGARWNRDMALPLLGAAVQATMRAIQDEAALIQASGVPFPPEGGFDDDGDHYDDEDDDSRLPLSTIKAKRKRKTLEWRWQRHLARQSENSGERHDYIAQIKSNGEYVLYSTKIASWGRTSEGAGHIGCIAKLAEARLSARPQDFDADPLLLNMQNGTIVFARPGDGRRAAVGLRGHRREDRMTKIGSAAFDAAARCPRFDAFLAGVQPEAEMREFLDDWAGYNSLGLADAQKMALFYGEGSNGKGVWVSTIAFILGDYAWSTGIETFMDAGRVRKGSDASPDLAALAGRRMVYANEPEDNSKFADGLIKSLTSDEPKGGVRELMKPPFELQITFTNTVMANTMPKISTDHGIQRRVQVVPWAVIIPDDQQDLRLKDKLKEAASGILNRMIAGALRYLDRGLLIPQAVKDATREYQQENDPLGRFIDLCVARVKGETVGATPFHRAFAAWQAWAGQLAQTGKPWSPKFLNAQMKRKSFKIAKSSTMQWQDIALRYDELDFVSFDDKDRMIPKEGELPPPRAFYGEAVPPAAASSPAPSPSARPDYDLPP